MCWILPASPTPFFLSEFDRTFEYIPNPLFFEWTEQSSRSMRNVTVSIPFWSVDQSVVFKIFTFIFIRRKLCWWNHIIFWNSPVNSENFMLSHFWGSNRNYQLEAHPLLRVASLSPSALSPQSSFNWAILHISVTTFFTFCCLCQH